MKKLLENTKKIEEFKEFKEYKEFFRDKLIELRRHFSSKYNSINDYEYRSINRLDFVEIIDDLIWLYENNYNSIELDVKFGADIYRLYDNCIKKNSIN